MDEHRALVKAVVVAALIVVLGLAVFLVGWAKNGWSTDGGNVGSLAEGVLGTAASLASSVLLFAALLLQQRQIRQGQSELRLLREQLQHAEADGRSRSAALLAQIAAQEAVSIRASAIELLRQAMVLDSEIQAVPAESRDRRARLQSLRTFAITLVQRQIADPRLPEADASLLRNAIEVWGLAPAVPHRQGTDGHGPTPTSGC